MKLNAKIKSYIDKGLTLKEIIEKMEGPDVTTGMITGRYYRLRPKPHHGVLPKAHRPKRKKTAIDAVLDADMSDREKVRLIKLLRQGGGR
jgi:aminoglycoside phosphotransferase (APT) family kinase protein